MSPAEEPATPPESHELNAATLQALRMRISADVHGRFWRSMGISYGGIGLGLSAITLVTWLPDKVVSQLRDSTTVQSTVAESAEEYLEGSGSSVVQARVRSLVMSDPSVLRLVAGTAHAHLADPQKGGRVIEEKLAEVARPLVDGVVQERLASDASLPERIRDEAQQFLRSDRGAELCAELIASQLDGSSLGPRAERLVHDELKRHAARFSASIEEDREKLVLALSTLAVTEGAEALHASRRFSKGGSGDLARILDLPSDRPEGDPLTLTLNVRRGMRYVADAIELFMNELRERAGPDFQLVLIQDADGSYLTHVTESRLRKILGNAGERDAFMDLVNASADVPATTAREELAELIGPESECEIPSSRTVQDSLLSDLWRTPSQTDLHHVVIDNQGKFLGITTRGRLIGTLLGSE